MNSAGGRLASIVAPHTATLPPHEPVMWRKLLAKVHPDANGDHELFIWTMHLRDEVCRSGVATVPPSGTGSREGARPQPPPSPSPPKPSPDRIPFDRDPPLGFSELTARALAMADFGETLPLYADLLRLLVDCEEAYSGPLYDQQKRGASYKQLAAIAYKVGMSKERRIGWYRLAESIPLSMRHAGHILKELAERAA
jgi:hypothetical protein